MTNVYNTTAYAFTPTKIGRLRRVAINGMAVKAATISFTVASMRLLNFQGVVTTQ